ncbi:MAG: flagellar basal body-associated FliL family protein, partial [Candidatus Latescibacteria bacterium]|nr:flagellar basal body-associated FliL family protein [Candidatus Latescibacterota bacterium]
WGPLAAIVLVAQGIVAWVVITTVFKDKVGGEEHAAEMPLNETQVQEGGAKEEHGGELPEYYSPAPLKKIMANPAGTDASRVVMVAVELGMIRTNKKPGEEEEKAAGGEGEGEGGNPAFAPMAPYAGKMRSMIIEMLSSRGVEELLDPEGRKELKEEIKKKLNSQILAKIPEFIPDPEKEDQKIFEIAEVEFSEFVIQ